VYSVQQTADRGYILAGRTRSFGAGQDDVLFIKTDSLGDILWIKTIGGYYNDYAYRVQQTADHGYVLSCETESFGAGGSDAWLIKTDSLGDTLWTRTYGGALYEVAYWVQQPPITAMSSLA